MSRFLNPRLARDVLGRAANLAAALGKRPLWGADAGRAEMCSRPCNRWSRRMSSAESAKTYEVVVFGGNGFVGTHVCKALVGMGLKVAAINRSGAPREREEWMAGVDYIAADVFEPEAWRSVLHGAVGAVAAIGAFGSYDFMKKVNGDANILVAEEAAAMGVQRMVFVSASFPPFPATIPLRGYIEGKESAEQAVRERFPTSHTILKPSVVYGSQKDAHPLIAGIRALGPIQVRRPAIVHAFTLARAQRTSEFDPIVS